jgi:hypothetical protein
MGAVIGFVILLLLNIFGFALPAMLAAWLFTLALPIAFNQALWLSLGMIILVAYLIQNIVDIPGESSFGLREMGVSVAVAFFLLVISALFGWLLWLFIKANLTVFEAVLLAAISLGAGIFFLVRAGTVGLPKWMTLDIEQDIDESEDDYIVTPPKRRSRRPRRGTGRR